MKKPIILIISFLFIIDAKAQNEISRNELTPIESDYASFSLTSRSISSENDLYRINIISKTYDNLFRSKQTPAIVHQLSNRDLNALFRSANDLSFYTGNERDVSDLSIDLSELEARHIATSDQRRSYYAALYQSRQFDKQSVYYNNNIDDLPKPIEFNDHKNLTHLHSELIPNLTKNSFERKSVNLKGLTIIVVSSPTCHYTQRAVKDIESNDELRKLLSKNTIWLSPDDQNMDLSLFQKWNREYPREAMAIAYRSSDWPEIDDWATPIFYIFRDGNIVSKVTGWPAGGHSKELINAIISARKNEAIDSNLSP